MPYLWIGLGSALGGIARHALSLLIASLLGSAFPYGTLLVNITGAILIGLISATNPSPTTTHFWMIGVLGGYTTFSAFSLQTVQMLQSSRWLAASLYILLSVALCLAGVIAGQSLARALR